MAESMNVVAIMKNTLNSVDARLIGHGDSIACSIYQLLHQTGRYSQKELRDICVLAMLHDIGAYKTEDINQLLAFETQSVGNHSIYGYLFLKHFSPFRELSPVVLHHHSSLEDMQSLSPLHQKLSQLFHFADRLDIARQKGPVGKQDMIGLLQRGRGRLFDPALVDVLLEEELLNALFDENAGDASDYQAFLHSAQWREEELTSLITLIVLSIDFRSPQTVTHTIATTCISAFLGRLMGLSEEEIETLQLGTWLHDIGKAGIPVDILEKNGKLDDRQFQVMRSHIQLTNQILEGNVTQELQRIAARHHEKLNGSGYPDGLSAQELTVSQRIVAVADVFSALSGVRSYKAAFPKSKVSSLLQQMADNNQLDAGIIEIALAHYDEIMEDVARHSLPIMDVYRQIQEEYDQLQLQSVQK